MNFSTEGWTLLFILTWTRWLDESATTIELSGPTAIPRGQVKHPGPLPRLPILNRSCLFCKYWLLRVVPTSPKPGIYFDNMTKSNLWDLNREVQNDVTTVGIISLDNWKLANDLFSKKFFERKWKNRFENGKKSISARRNSPKYLISDR